jgi:hypothetical protein
MKKTVIKALLTEPLMSGNWISEGLNDGDCMVCAVGAILRKSGFYRNKIMEFGENMIESGACTPWDERCENSFSLTIDKHLKNGRYLHALSLKFESMESSKKPTATTRKSLVKFVEKNFPNRIKINPKF